MSFHYVPNFVRTSSRKAELPQHKPGSPRENWWVPTTSQLHFFAAQSLFSSSCRCCRRWQLETSSPKLIILAGSLLRTILDPASWWLRFLHSRLSCEDPCWNGPNCEHSLEKKEGHLALATSTVATLRVAILWFPTQAISKLSWHGGWRRTWQMWHWPWNVKSTVRKARLARPSPAQGWIAWARVVATYNLAASLFLHCTISIEDHFRPC